MKTSVRILSLLVLSFVVSVATSAALFSQKYSSYNEILSNAEKIRGNYIPFDFDDAVRELETLLDEKDKAYIRDSMALGELEGEGHFGVGMFIRNRWGLWQNSRLAKYFEQRRFYHPDNMSDIVLEGIDYKLHGKVYDFNAMVKREDSLYRARKSNPKFTIPPKSREDKKRHKEYQKEVVDRLKSTGLRKGEIVYFKYTYGCSNQEEADMVSESTSEKKYGRDKEKKYLAKGKIVDVHYFGLEPKIKVKLIYSSHPDGIILFDPDTNPHNDEHRYKIFLNKGSKRYYMKKGDKMWFLKRQFNTFWVTEHEVKKRNETKNLK